MKTGCRTIKECKLRGGEKHRKGFANVVLPKAWSEWNDLSVRVLGQGKALPASYSCLDIKSVTECTRASTARSGRPALSGLSPPLSG